ncbi:YhfX family PLP-dependent enzyme [Metabacillus idriensis]|uniref:YhfX family PLP-dependent enzyme n=1 Tax=Metabacillus idriensis TaxID=324768 RepID=UPI00174AB6AB|nr:YhfX family PLP-dependent enzyme [Metabacillus idriensis]
MFLDMLQKRNPALIKAAAALHQSGSIPPNTYVIDLDSFERNVRALAKSAVINRVKLFYMTKQIGRSGFVGKTIQRNGIEKAVAVDIDEAFNLSESGCRIGNLGHLVQPGKHQWGIVLKQLRPEVVTLFSLERGRQLSEAAVKLGLKQDVILRVISKHDFIYPGQYGGILIDELEPVIRELQRMPGINVIGVTCFPVMQLNEAKTDFEFTSNLQTLLKSREILDNQGIEAIHLNAPSSTSCHTMPLLRKYGITHGEPGHALTGTTPLHAYSENLIEKPCIAYLSEISHMDEDQAYTIAGGFYARSNMTKALFGNRLDQETAVHPSSSENIDYYGSLKRNPKMNVGDAVLYAFRTQIFVTRSHVAFLKNVDSKTPEVLHFQRRGV